MFIKCTIDTRIYIGLARETPTTNLDRNVIKRLIPKKGSAIITILTGAFHA